MTASDAWREMGFRWTQRTDLDLNEETQITVEPSMHMSSREKGMQNEQEKKTLRFYRVWDGAGNELGERSELDLEKMIAR